MWNWLSRLFGAKKKPGEFAFGRDEFLGGDLVWSLSQMVLGMLLNGSTGAGKTVRCLLMLLVRLLQLRLSQEDDEQWGGLFLDPKQSFAARLTGLIKYAGFGDELDVLDEHHQITINPFMSGLSGAKIAEMIVKSLAAGKAMSQGSGSFYYESRATALLGDLNDVVLCAARPCLKLVGEMADTLSIGGAVNSSDPRATEALRRIKIFMAGEEKERRMVLDSVQNYLAPYRHAPWKNIFWEPGQFNLDAIRDEGRLLVVSFSPNKVNHLNSGLFLLKTLFYSVIMDRMTTGFAGNKTRVCFFVCDEFQQVVSGGGSDADFLAVRREARCAPIVAFQQLSQLRSVIPNEWETVVGLLNIKIFLRQSDVDTAMFAEKLCGFVELPIDAVTKAPDAWRLFYQESSRTTTRQLQPRVPAEYFRSLPDGDAVIVSDRVEIAWFPAAGMTAQEEKSWRKSHWPRRPRLLHPRDFRQ
jgi:hypothetical protein